MKKTLILLAVAAICNSCSTYYYSTIGSSNENITQNDHRSFVSGNDDVSIVYNFYGEDAPIHITIINKTDKPMFVDWKQSALIINNNSSSYHNPNMSISGEMKSTTYIYSNYFSDLVNSDLTISDFSATVTQPQSVSFIPPKSKIECVPMKLSNFNFEGIPDSDYNKKQFGANTVKECNYLEEESPLQFRSYLTLYNDNPQNSDSKSQAFEQSFYLSRIMKTGSVSPKDLLENKMQWGDFFYVKKTKGQGAGNFIGIIAVAAATDLAVHAIRSN